MSISVESLRGRFAGVLDDSCIEVRREGFPELDLTEPALVVSPQTVEALSETMRFVASEKIPLVPMGSGSAFHFGNLPAEASVFLSTKNLNATVDYEPRDLTIIAQAGKPLGQLQRELRQSGQYVALDPPNASRATIGGVVATNRSGPLRLAYGTPRDLCLGVKVVLADGTLVKGGGKVMKNVAGYDTTRLFVGSFGTLGVVVEAAFRSHPLPESGSVVLGIRPTWADAVELANRIVYSELEPTFLELLNRGDERWGYGRVEGFAPTVMVGFGGKPEPVDYQTTRVEEMMAEAKATGVETARPYERWRRRRLDALDGAMRDGETTVCKMNVAMTDLLSMIVTTERVVGERDMGVQWLCHYAAGVAYALLRADSTDNAVGAVESLRKEVAALGGGLVVESAPMDVKQRLDIWGEPTGPLNLMRQVKRRLDPELLLNRGRYLRGLE